VCGMIFYWILEKIKSIFNYEFYTRFIRELVFFLVHVLQDNGLIISLTLFFWVSDFVHTNSLTKSISIIVLLSYRVSVTYNNHLSSCLYVTFNASLSLQSVVFASKRGDYSYFVVCLLRVSLKTLFVLHILACCHECI
jgi:hypothetical protein